MAQRYILQSWVFIYNSVSVLEGFYYIT